MKTVTVKYQIYKFNELSREAKDRAIKDWYEHEEYPFLEEDLTESCKALLEENKITIKEDLRLEYSLSYCQDAGLNFVGNFYWKNYDIHITHTYNYSFASASNIMIMNEEGEEIENEKIFEQFKNIYLKICRELEKEGYGILEYRMDDKEFAEHCEVNEYNFFKDGKMANL